MGRVQIVLCQPAAVHAVRSPGKFKPETITLASKTTLIAEVKRQRPGTLPPIGSLPQGLGPVPQPAALHIQRAVAIPAPPCIGAAPFAETRFLCPPLS